MSLCHRNRLGGSVGGSVLRYVILSQKHTALKRVTILFICSEAWSVDFSRPMRTTDFFWNQRIQGRSWKGYQRAHKNENCWESANNRRGHVWKGLQQCWRNFFFILSQAWRLKRTLLNLVLFRGLVSRCSGIVFDFFCEKGKGKSCDKYAVLQVRWCEVIRHLSESMK